MGRKPGSKNKARVPASDRVTTTKHNVSPAVLSDEQAHALLDTSARKYAKALELKKKYDDELKLIAKTIKADGVALSAVKLYLEASTEEGQAKIVERVEEAARIARWRNFPLGTQATLFPDGMTPAMSFTRGKEAGFAGLAATPPSEANTDEWLRGWHSAQEALRSGFRDLESDQPERDAFDTAAE